MNRLIVPCGYMGSGSSAITDLMKEIENYKTPNNDFEYVFLHCPNGVFDLEDKLLNGNNAIRSDEAIHSFIGTMKLLYDKKNYWVGMYKSKVSVDFMKYCYEFIEKLNVYKYNNTYWYYQQIPDVRMSMQNYFRRIIAKLSNNKILLDVPLRYDEMIVAYPSEIQFYTAARDFINKVFSCFNEDCIIMDQLLLPQNIKRIPNYFDDRLKVFLVDRDPRDVFFSNKYIWAKKQFAVPYPMDVENFCEVYRRQHNMVYHGTNKQTVLEIRFEDLIYRYTETLNEIYEFLKISEKSHINKKKYFNPEISKNNTAIFRSGMFPRSECRYIEEHLKEFLYPFEKNMYEGDYNKIF